MKWKDKLISNVIKELDRDSRWQELLKKASRSNEVAVHLAILTEPFLTLILQGEKKVESRFSINRISPYGQIKEGDVVILKKSGGPVVGLFVAGKIEFISNLNQARLFEIEKQYGTLIGTQFDSAFWKKRSRSNFATLIFIKNLKRINPISSSKNDRRGWVVLNSLLTNTLFDVEHV